MYKKIAIICALKKEVEAVLDVMTNVKEEKKYDLKIYIGNIEGSEKEIILSECEVGKLRAARVTQIIIDFYNPDLVINMGSAGSVNENLEIGDVVIGKRLVEIDADCTAFGTQKGKFQDYEDLYVLADEKLIEESISALQNVSGVNKIIAGTIATSDKFLTDEEEKKQINKEFEADCAEMEGTAVAKACKMSNMPFIIFRGISDKHNDPTPVETYENYKKYAAERCMIFIKNFISMN